MSGAWVYTDVNQVISTSRFGKEVWPKGNLRAEFKGVGGREKTLSPTLMFNLSDNGVASLPHQYPRQFLG